MRRIILAWGATESPGKEVCFVGLGVEINYVGYLVIAAIFMGVGGAKN